MKFVIIDHTYNQVVIITAKTIYGAVQIYLRDWYDTDNITVYKVTGEK